MAGLRLSLSKLFVVLSLALGRMPRIVTLLELLYTPSVAHVMITRRRRIGYADFFTRLDRDGRRAARASRAAAAAPERYIPVDTA